MCYVYIAAFVLDITFENPFIFNGDAIKNKRQS